jgi:excisionase family DNA binding protein
MEVPTVTRETAEEHAMDVPLGIGKADQEEIVSLYEKMRSSHARLVRPDGTTRTLPESLYQFLVELISDLVKGESVSIIQEEAKLTTVEAASLLGVSRQFLIKLLDEREIPHIKVGTHRRIYVHDLLVYKAKRDRERRRVLDELAAAEAQEGLYEIGAE